VTNWNRGRSFNPGVRASYAALQWETPITDENDENRGKGGDGRGDAAMGGAPRPQPGDELHATIVRAEADKHEQDRRADIVARRDHDYAPGTSSLFALAMLEAATRTGDQQQQQAQPERQAEQSRPEISFQSMKAAQAEIGAASPSHQGRAQIDAPPRPGSGDLYDLVSEKTHTETEALWRQQAQERSRQQGLGLGM
jgi:hypothetical protein